MRGVLPNITLPTRISETACTLIDNVITNTIFNGIHMSGVLIGITSYHQMDFGMRNHQKRTTVKCKYRSIKS